MKYTERLQQQAVQLITTTSLSYPNIAARIGFPNARDMSAYLKRKVGMTSIQLRAAHPRHAEFKHGLMVTKQKAFVMSEFSLRTDYRLYDTLFDIDAHLCFFRVLSAELGMDGKYVQLYQKSVTTTSDEYGRADVIVSGEAFGIPLSITFTLFRNTGMLTVSYKSARLLRMLSFNFVLEFSYQPKA